jgi:dipeptidyl aminopeptidase/acylaminoacyl peptidase
MRLHGSALLLVALLLSPYTPATGQSGSKENKEDKKKSEPFKIRRITQGMGIQRLGPLSPDGRSVALIAKKADGNPNLYVMDVSNFAITPLTNLKWGVADPSWSPDGELIAFSGFNEDASFSEIFTVNVGTRDLRQYTKNGFTDKEPVFARDGKRIFFTTDESPLAEAAFGILHVASVPVGKGKPEAFTEDEVSTIRPGILRNRDNILLIKVDEHSGRHSLMEYGPDGKLQRDLTERRFARIHGYLATGPGNPLVLWAQEQPEEQEFVFIFDAGTGKVRELPDPDTPKISPSVSPDGKLIAYISPTATGNQLFLFDTSSDQIQQLTLKGNTFSAVFVSNTAIAFGSNREKENEIFLVDLVAAVPETQVPKPKK